MTLGCPLGVMKCLELDIMVIQHCEYIKVTLKLVIWLCEFHLNENVNEQNYRKKNGYTVSEI